MYWAIWHILAGCSATCDIHFHYLCDVEKGVGKIGLAISGGCARVAAAIGVLKVIERMGIRPDVVVGTSAGAIVGALYCCGYSADEMAQICCSQSWRKILNGKQYWALLEEMTGRRSDTDFDTLPIPFRCVATCLDDYTEQVLNHGVLADCVKASAAMPLLFPPVSIQGKRLVDGGMVNNLPTDVLRNMGIDTIIAIDLQQITFWQAGFSLKEWLGIGGLLHWAVSHPEVKRYRQNVKLADIYIKPPLKVIDGYIFSNSRSRRMIEAGEASARRYCPQLQALRNAREEQGCVSLANR